MWLLILLLCIVIDVVAIVAGIYSIWWLLGISLFLALIVTMYLIIGAVAINQALYVKRRSYDEVLYQDKKFGIPSEVSVLPFERVVIKGSEGYDMVASLMRSRTGESHKYFIICHGYNSNRVTCNKYANVLLDLGYNTLCPDMRRCGETGGHGITFGVMESVDINLWIDYIKSIDDKAEISLYGISLGAAASVMVASERDDIHSLISYCSYASLREIMLDRIVHSKIPMFLAKMIYPIIRDYVRLHFGNKNANTDIVDCIKRVKCPTIIIHSNGDRFTNIRHAYALHQAKPDATFVEFDDAPHARSYGVYPSEYQDVLRSFIHAVESGEKMEDRHIHKSEDTKIEPTNKEDDNMTL